ncbi:MFS transporter [Pseudogemmobacter humi]|uniref:Major Facilitator Superfamily protein n=1 Tax=Pseudogemmobacter humi TaxID=2483812 RepID=A0A3P5XK43_9RHOB|nr:MFS transporter [Pseudogemmobacter humi]VDC28028.1 Major Facilitator Superfamily protein [Pseudogemmobacter humi]
MSDPAGRLIRPQDEAAATGRQSWRLGQFYAVSILARSLLIAVIPAIALLRLGDAGLVSAVYFASSCLTFTISLALPRVLHRLGLRGILAAGTLSGVLCGLSFLLPGLAGLVPGLTLHVLMVLCFENASNLAALRLIARRDQPAFEARRVMLAAPAYMLGPVIGTALQEAGLVGLVFAAAALCACLAPLLVFMAGRGAAAVRPAPAAPAASGFALRGFLSAPRLRAAWLLAVGRAMWWQMLFVYTPLMALSLGEGLAQAGIVVSLASALLLSAPLWARLTRRMGLRRFMIAAYILCGLFACLAGVLAQYSFPLFAAAILLSALGVSAIDSVANTPFLRAVRPRDAARMVPIYNTFREVAQIVPAGVYALLLLFAEIRHIFILTGLSLAAFAWFCRFLPRRG